MPAKKNLCPFCFHCGTAFGPDELACLKCGTGRMEFTIDEKGNEKVELVDRSRIPPPIVSSPVLVKLHIRPSSTPVHGNSVVDELTFREDP